MDNFEFEQAWQNLLRDVFVGGNLTIGNITQILNIFIVISQPSPPESTKIPENISYRGAVKFFGRFEELKTLQQRLQQTDRVAISVVSGMGGVGKTELAIQYARQYTEDYPGGICWLQARLGDISNQILKFARDNLKLAVPHELGGELLNPGEKVKWCWQNWQPPGTVLLIIDDVTDLASFREIIHELPKCFRVLITTRQRNLDTSFDPPLFLDVLSLEASLELLIALIGESRVERERQTAESLCKWLGYLPLGLELVGRYLAKDRFLRIEKMLERMKAQSLKNEALDEKSTGYVMTAQRGVRAAFELSWKELEKLSQIATDIARLIGLLELDIFSWELVDITAKSLSWSEQNVEEARRELDNLHLIQPTNDSEQEFGIHPLIREFLREKLVNYEQINKLVQAITYSRNELVCRYYERGNYSEAEALYLEDLNFRQKWPSEANLDITVIVNNLAGICYEQDRYIEAELYCQAIFETRQRSLRKNHPDVVANMSNLALIKFGLRQYREAITMLQKVRKLREQICRKSKLVNDYLNLANTYTNLAIVYHEASERLGRYEYSEDSDRSFSQRPLKQIFSFVDSIINKSDDKNRKLDKNEIEFLYETALDIKYHIFEQCGENHPELANDLKIKIANDLDNLARFYLEQNRYTDAEKLYLDSLNIKENILGNSKYSIALSYENIGDFYREKQDVFASTDYYWQAFDIYKQVVGFNHIRTARVRMNLEKFLLFVYFNVTEGERELSEEQLADLNKLWIQIFGRGSFTEYLRTNYLESKSECVKQLIETRECEWCDLSGADLSDKDLSGINLRNAILFCANLSGSKLSNANLQNCDLIGANLTNIYMEDVSLERADLSYCDMSNSSIIGINMTETQSEGLIQNNCTLVGIQAAYTTFGGWSNKRLKGIFELARY